MRFLSAAVRTLMLALVLVAAVVGACIGIERILTHDIGSNVAEAELLQQQIVAAESMKTAGNPEPPLPNQRPNSDTSGPALTLEERVVELEGQKAILEERIKGLQEGVVIATIMLAAIILALCLFLVNLSKKIEQLSEATFTEDSVTGERVHRFAPAIHSHPHDHPHAHEHDHCHDGDQIVYPNGYRVPLRASNGR